MNIIKYSLSLILGQSRGSSYLRQGLVAIHKLVKQNHYHRVQSRFDQFEPFIGPHQAEQYFQRLTQNLCLSWQGITSSKEQLKNLIHINKSQEWEQLLNSDTPQIFWGLHFGPFELMHQVLTLSSKRVHLVTLEKPNSQLSNLRRRDNLTIWSHHDIAQAIHTCKKEKAILAVLVDQGPQNQAQITQLMGKETSLFLKLMLKAKGMGFESVHFRIQETSQQHLRLDWTPTTHYNEVEISHLLSEQIISSPLDWVWHYKWHWPHIKKAEHKARL